MRGCWIILLVLVLARPAAGQASGVLSEEAQISLLTILPGDAVYSMFGHSAFRVYDPARGIDSTYNYGTFDFGDPLSFVARFSYGKLDYFLSKQPFGAAMQYYWQVEGRPVVEQVLNLDAGQRSALYQFLEINARPENRYYRYDFFFDNCATRPRDVLKAVFGEALEFADTPDPGLSFRQLIDLYAADKPFVDLGMDLGLGAPADAVATPAQTMFLPDFLMAAFDNATIRSDGTVRPLVARRETVAGVITRRLPEASLPWPAMLTWLLFGAGLVLTGRDVRGRRAVHRIFDPVLFGLVGVAGLLIVYLWFVSLHTVTQGNYNLLWAWPTHAGAAIVLARRAPGRRLGFYLAAAALAALITLLGWPFWPQQLPPAMLPLVLLLLLRSAWLAWCGLTFQAVTPTSSEEAEATA